MCVSVVAITIATVQSWHQHLLIVIYAYIFLYRLDDETDFKSLALLREEWGENDVDVGFFHLCMGGGGGPIWTRVQDQVWGTECVNIFQFLGVVDTQLLVLMTMAMSRIEKLKILLDSFFI